MHFGDRIILIGIAEQKDERGDLVEKETRTEVWADRRSVTRSEYYAAQTAGMSADKVFVVWQQDYAGQARLSHEGTEYDITRTYQRDPYRVELICRVGVRS